MIARRILTHDASTLGGNSGSALIDFDADGQTVLGLHFAGYHQRQNWAHGLEKITRELARASPGRMMSSRGHGQAGRPGAPRRLSGSRNGRGADPAGVLAAAWPPAIHVLAGAIVRDDWPRIVMTWDQFRFRYGGFPPPGHRAGPAHLPGHGASAGEQPRLAAPAG